MLLGLTFRFPLNGCTSPLGPFGSQSNDHTFFNFRGASPGKGTSFNASSAYPPPPPPPNTPTRRPPASPIDGLDQVAWKILSPIFSSSTATSRPVAFSSTIRL